MTEEERQILIEEKEQARQIQAKRLAIKEQQRAAQKVQDQAASQEAKKLREKLLSSNLLQEVELNNKWAQEILKKEIKEELPESDTEFDLDTDSWITKFVDSTVAFNNPQYVPKQLQKIWWEYINDVKWNSTLRLDAHTQFQKLAEEFYLRFNIPIKVVSAYRWYDYQKRIKENGCPDSLCAKAWHSEHQSWLAIDLWEASDYKSFMSSEDHKNYFDWTIEVAHKYGFINTYQDWVEADWYQIEPWHWRYVWVDLARFLKEYDFSFKEYYDLVQENKK